MEQEDITQIYETLAPMAGQYANAQAEQIGQAQQSMGPLAAATMGQSQTAGLGNYTYNRLMRPQVDVMRDEILVEGYRNKLNQALSNAYKTAQRNYSRRAGSGGGGGNSGGGSTNPSGVNDSTEKEYTDASTPISPEKPDVENYISSGYEFGNYGNLPGQTGQYPLLVETPTVSRSYQDYTRGISDPMDKGNAWIKYLKSIGYGG